MLPRLCFVHLHLEPPGCSFVLSVTAFQDIDIYID